MDISNIPLAEYLRPRNLQDVIGQQHLLGPDAVLRKSLESGQLFSMILWGPPGVGKTTLAGLFAGVQGRSFYSLSAVSSGVKEVREVINRAERDRAEHGVSPVLFIDEVHRFSKSQQDSLLGAVEKGTVILIGATTENPSFEVIAPLLSRCRLFVLQHLSVEEMLKIAERAVNSDYFRSRKIYLKETESLIRLSGGDARKLLGILELVLKTQSGQEVTITNELVSHCVQQNLPVYDKAGEQHYDVVSAFIKSLRGSDPNAAVYWLARMIEGGEDPLFIARRMLILASEDIGNANPTALVLANAAFQSAHQIGYPECRIILSQCAVYLACSPKSNASYVAIDSALAEIRSSGGLPVPLHLRNAVTGTMKNLGYGENYKYAHAYEGNFTEQEFMPEKLIGKVFYIPGQNAREGEMHRFLRTSWKGKYGY